MSRLPVPPDVARLAEAKAVALASRSRTPITGARLRALRGALEAVVMEQEYQHALEWVSGLRCALVKREAA